MKLWAVADICVVFGKSARKTCCQPQEKKKAGNPYSFCYVPVSLCLSDTGKGMTLEKKVALFCFPDEEGLWSTKHFFLDEVSETLAIFNTVSVFVGEEWM